MTAASVNPLTVQTNKAHAGRLRPGCHHSYLGTGVRGDGRARTGACCSLVTRCGLATGLLTLGGAAPGGRL